MRKVAFHTLGCKVNIYETEAMQELMKHAGYELVEFSDKADIYVVNTCSVTNIADRKSRQMLHKAKNDNPEAIVVAVGCYVQASAEAAKLDEKIDIIIGNNMKNRIVEIIDKYYENLEGDMVDVSSDFVADISKEKNYEEFKLAKQGEHTRAFIKVQDGCNQFCTYCIIPYTRGRVRSRRLEDIISEVNELVSRGYKEMVLTGIHLSSYGTDFDESLKLIELIETVANVEGVKRLRIGSLEPRIITKEFLESLSKLEAFCPHFHLSLQSGSDKVLKAMARRYDTKEFLEGAKLIREYFDNPALTTDVIVGFPGESEDDFIESVDFSKKIGFFEMHIFPYSKREGTKAAQMRDALSNKDKSRRLNLLSAEAKLMNMDFLKNSLGKEAEVLIEDQAIELNGSRYMLGYSKEYIKVALPYKEAARNEIIRVKLKSILSDAIVYGEEL